MRACSVGKRKRMANKSKFVFCHSLFFSLCDVSSLADAAVACSALSVLN